eukprot:2505854-Rhodomonas_salina.1
MSTSARAAWSVNHLSAFANRQSQNGADMRSGATRGPWTRSWRSTTPSLAAASTQVIPDVLLRGPYATAGTQVVYGATRRLLQPLRRLHHAAPRVQNLPALLPPILCQRRARYHTPFSYDSVTSSWVLTSRAVLSGTKQGSHWTCPECTCTTAQAFAWSRLVPVHEEREESEGIFREHAKFIAKEAADDD